MIVKMKTGKAVKNSGRGGIPPTYILGHVEIVRDVSERIRFDRSRWLPHDGDRKADRERRRFADKVKKAEVEL